jgi:N-acetylmuramoyl-L-alanine amidase/Domain of unknown function (DUF4214)
VTAASALTIKKADLTMRLLRIPIAVLLTAPMVVASVVTPVWGAEPSPVAPQIDTVSVALDPGTADAGSVTATAQSPVTVVTAPLATDTFASVGATWDASTGTTPPTIEVRTSSGDGWSDWRRLPAIDEGPDPDTAEARNASTGATAALWVGDSDEVQVRVSGQEAALPDKVELALVDPGRSRADGLPAAPLASADAAAAVPTIISRAQWGADESLKSCRPSYNSTIKAAVLHHTAGPNSYSSVADAMRQLRSDYAYHTRTLGWCDLGYNFVLDKWGNIYEGRAGGVDRPVVGAHTGGFNKDTFGVSMLGDYSDVTPPAALQQALAELVGWKLSLHGVTPNGRVTLTSAGGGTSKYAAGAAVALPTIFGHRDVGSTACPGNAGYAILPGLRAGATARLATAPFVRALYADMMTRAADNAGLADWTSRISANGGDRRAVARGFSTSSEYRLLKIDQAYAQVLGRAPDPAGRAGWLDALQRGLRIDQLRTSLMASEEFYYRGGSSDAAFVDNIYRAALGRGAAPSEVAGWAQVRRVAGPGAVIAAVWGAPEAGMRRVNEGYAYYLGRQASVPERQGWLPIVMGSGDEQLREELVVSNEYLARATVRFP